jgi:acetylornithine deacetylase/succinyl-diaminopimelate desuccinylase-like protein
LGLFFLLSASIVESQDRYPVPWEKVEKETLEHFQALVRIDTSNPPGNETKAAEYLKKVLNKEGISAELLALDSNRANLVARIRGSGWFKKPILVMGHTDVVGVQKEKWSVDPFVAVRKDGYIWGRGTLDDKDNVTAGLMLMLLLKRQGVKLDRDVIFLAEAGEEGFDKEGLRYVVASHWDRINAEFALAEGGGGIIKDGKVQHIGVATSEKVPRGMRLIARGTSGHGSTPRPDNAIVHLANALARLGAWLPPMKLDETTRTYFERLAEISPPEAAARYRSLLTPKEGNEAELYFVKNELTHNSMIRTSISPTVLKGGVRNNVIPSEAEAYLDVRALPDEDMDQFVRQMREVIGDPIVEIKPNPWRDAAPASKLGTEMFNALERTQKRLYPGSVTLPVLVTGATDMSQLRVKGVQAYGIGPLMLEKDIKEGVGAHSDNERILEKSLHGFVQFMWYAVLEVAASK